MKIDFEIFTDEGAWIKTELKDVQPGDTAVIKDRNGTRDVIHMKFSAGNKTPLLKRLRKRLIWTYRRMFFKK